MAYEAIRKSTLSRTLADALADLSDLVRTELRLANAEFSEKVKGVVRASVWMVIAAVLGLLALAALVEAIIFALASTGLAMHWSCLIVAAGLAVLGLIAFAGGRSAAGEGALPTRSIRQINESIRTAKEQLT